MVSQAEIVAFLADEFPQFKSTVEAVGARSATIRHQVTHDDLRPGGTVSGPTLFGLADAALYVAILGEIGLVGLAVTTNMTINFLSKPSSERDVIVQCRLIKVGKRLIVGEAFLYSEGMAQAVAHAIGTYSVPPR